MLRLFINADDFGLSRNVNNGIVECFERNYVSATTLMVNMPFCDEAVDLSHRHGFSDCVGLHLNISEGYPLSEQIKSVPLFVGNNGRFSNWFRQKTIKQFLLSRHEKSALKEEFEAQIKKFLSLGFCGHLDSHQHSHTCWFFFEVLAPLLLKYNFLTVRLSRNISNESVSPLIYSYKAIFNTFLKNKTTVLTKHFTSFASILEQGFPKDGVTELMCHPDYSSDGALINIGNVGFEELFKNIKNYRLLKPIELQGVAL